MLFVLRTQEPNAPDPEPVRLVGPPPSLVHVDDPHVGMRWHCDDPHDQAITIQVTSWALTL